MAIFFFIITYILSVAKVRAYYTELHGPNGLEPRTSVEDHVTGFTFIPIVNTFVALLSLFLASSKNTFEGYPNFSSWFFRVGKGTTPVKRYSAYSKSDILLGDIGELMEAYNEVIGDVAKMENNSPEMNDKLQNVKKKAEKLLADYHEITQS